MSAFALDSVEMCSGISDGNIKSYAFVFFTVSCESDLMFYAVFDYVLSVSLAGSFDSSLQFGENFVYLGIVMSFSRE